MNRRAVFDEERYLENFVAVYSTTLYFQVISSSQQAYSMNLSYQKVPQGQDSIRMDQWKDCLWKLSLETGVLRILHSILIRIPLVTKDAAYSLYTI
jgi:hypothetical protein